MRKTTVTEPATAGAGDAVIETATADGAPDVATDAAASDVPEAPADDAATDVTPVADDVTVGAVTSATLAPEAPVRHRWGADFDPDRLALLELRMWKAYYRRQPARLFGNLVKGLHEQADVGWPRAVLAAILLTKAAVGFSRASGDYERFAPDVARGYRLLGLPGNVDVETVAGEELHWWVVRREIGLGAGQAAGETIARLYAALYVVPVESVAEAGRLRGLAAEVRDRGAVADQDGPLGRGDAYWPEVSRLLRDSYRSLRSALA